MKLPYLLLSPSGRVSRRTFAFAALILSAAWVIVWSLAAVLFAIVGYLAAVPVMAVGTVAIVYCYACLCTKRLHDLGRSGWWQAVPVGFALFSLGAILLGAPDRIVDAATPIVSVFIVLWVGVLGAVLVLAPGAPTENPYGVPDVAPASGRPPAS